MATLSPNFHVSINAGSLPIFIPASDLPDVELSAAGFHYVSYQSISDPDRAHAIALRWLGAERAMRKRAAEQEAERLREEAAEKAKAAEEEAIAAAKAKAAEEEEAAVVAEAKELRMAFYKRGISTWDTAAPVNKEPWLRVARESLQRNGKLDRHE